MRYRRIFVSVISIIIILSMGCFANGFTKSKAYPDAFSDVDKSGWYAEGIKDVYELGLMNGISDTKFDIDGKMTVAQAVTIAARLHSIYNGTEIPDANSDGGQWYDKYINYCLNNSIIKNNQFDVYNRDILSYEAVTLFSDALPVSFYNKINNVTGILDVPESVSFAENVFLFYNAGILCGNDDYGTFLPMEKLTRARAATIISRITLPEKRMNFSLLKQKENYDIDTVLKILSYQVQTDTLDKITLMSVDGIDISGAEYRYYSYANNGNKKKIESAVAQNTALIRLAQSSYLKIPRSSFCNMLTSYYNAKTAKYLSGSFYDVLESNRLSDAVFARLIVINELTPLLIGHLYSNLSPSVISEYANKNGYICARHILISNETPDAYKTIKEVENKLNSGVDFTTLVNTYGQDTGMKNRPYGYFFKSGTMTKAFEDAAFALNDGQISGIVRTDYGYHIIQRLEIIPERLENSMEYSGIATEAAVQLFNTKANSLISSFDISYVSNFDNLAAIID